MIILLAIAGGIAAAAIVYAYALVWADYEEQHDKICSACRR